MNHFEILLLKEMDRLGLKSQSWLVAVSGGLDSMGLLEALTRVAPRREIRIHVAHVHHGVHENRDYRDLAAAKVEQYCSERSIAFHKIFNQDSSLKTETELRSYRRKKLFELKDQLNCQLLVMAHHADDVFETRLMRLIRGVGAQGIPAILVLSKQQILRPLLRHTREEIRSYAQFRKVKWLDDPTNFQASSLRNFIRQSWLPQLEHFQPGATKALARSLGVLSRRHSKRLSEAMWIFDDTGIDRKKWLSLSDEEKKQNAAAYFLSRQLRNFTSGHIQELIKRLDSEKKEFRFRMLKRDWAVDTQRIRVL